MEDEDGMESRVDEGGCGGKEGGASISVGELVYTAVSLSTPVAAPR